MIVSLEIPYPPSTNNLYKTVNGRRVKSAEARLYANAVVWAVRLSEHRNVRFAEGAELAALMEFTVGDRRRHDLGNLEKAAMDSLAKALGFDDTQIFDMRLRKRYKKGVFACRVTLTDSEEAT